MLRPAIQADPRPRRRAPAAVALALAALAAAAGVSRAQAAGAPPLELAGGYRLIWHDEFDRDGRPDPGKWTYETGYVRNREPQWYQPDNALVAHGLLTIEARKGPGDGRSPGPDSARYTSASLISRGRFAFRYGKVFMRARLDVRQGMWPAFWMKGTQCGPVPWPACGEVDIMEFYRRTLLGNIFWDGGTKDTRIPLEELGGDAWAKAFHVWELDWNARSMVIRVDGRLVNRFDLAQTVNAGDRRNPFQQPMYLLFDLALGQHREPIPERSLPGRLDVDYVRVYQRPDEGEATRPTLPGPVAAVTAP